MIRIKSNGILLDKTIGYSNFLTILSKHLIDHGIELTAGYPKDCDLYLLNNLDESLVNNIPFILRLDGFGLKDNAVDIAKRLCSKAKHTIFQSEFALNYSKKFLSVNKYSIINNGVELIDLNKTIRTIGPFSAATIIHNWIEERAYSFLNYCIALRHFQIENNVKIKHYVVGDTSFWNIKERILEHFQDLDIVFTGLVDRDRLDTIRREVDFIVHLTPMGWCDNSCLEAINYELPIIYDINSGNKDLVDDAGIGVDVSRIGDITKAIKLIIQELAGYSYRAKCTKCYFNIKDIAKEYAEVIKSCK